MAELARKKHPTRTIRVGRAEELPEQGLQFDAIFCLHLFMHLTPSLMAQILAGCTRCAPAGGRLIFGIPSVRPRTLTGFRPSGWPARHALAHPRPSDVPARRRALPAWPCRLCFP